MSIKIYNGYKVPLDKLHLAVKWFRISMWRRVVALASTEVSTYPEATAWCTEHGDCGFHVWVDGTSQEALIALFGMPIFTDAERSATGLAWEKWNFPKWIEEFSFWDNTDPPDDMSEGEGYERWVNRGLQWKRVAMDGDLWDMRLTHIVLDKSHSAMSLAMECIPKIRKAWNKPKTRLLSQQKLPQ